MNLPKGIPSHDTFGRIFAKIKPEEFQERFIEWVKAIESITNGQVIAVDGKQLRGSHDRRVGKSAIYMVNAWATANQLVLGQRKVDDKSNEITAIPKLLKLLEISGCIVTIDAIGTQTEIAKMIIQGGGDYLLAVKENQGHLFDDIQFLFETDAKYEFEQVAHSYTKTINKGHGRIEVRECWAIDNEEYLNQLQGRENWIGLKSIVRIVSQRQIGEQVENKNRAISSPVYLPKPKPFSKRNVATGKLRINFIGR